MIGKLLTDSGGADRIVDTVTSRVGDENLPWAMALIAAILGLPLFFEVGVVLLCRSSCWSRAAATRR